MTIRRAVTSARYVGIAILGIACGSESTEPEGPASNADVTGRWSYSANNVAGTGANCSISGVTLALTQTGSSVGGSTTGGTISCTINGNSLSGRLDSESIANGSIDKTAIAFDIGDADVRNVGSVSQNSMTGTVSIRFSASGGVVPISGPFAAVRQ